MHGGSWRCQKRVLYWGFALAWSPAWAAEHFDGRVFYIGDIHAHSGASLDGASSDLGDCTGECGSLADIGVTARDNGLDFLALTDHVNGPMTSLPADYLAGLDKMASEHDPEGGFVTIPGAELMFEQEDSDVEYGHKTLLLFGDSSTLADLRIDDVRPEGATEATIENCIDIWDWMVGLSADFGPALLVAHHPALDKPMPTNWGCHNTAYAPGVEVYSGHGSSLGLSDGFAEPWSGEIVSGTVLTALTDHDRQLGFLGGSDNHDTRPGDACAIDTIRTAHPFGQGFTIAVMDEDEAFERETLYQAFMERRTYATTGPMMPADVMWSRGELELGGMGEVATASEATTLSLLFRVPPDLGPYVTEVWVHTPEDSRLADGPGEPGEWSLSIESSDLPAWAFVEARIDGALWYAGETCEEGGVEDLERLWLSPTWFEYQEDFDGDGWSATEGDCDDYDAGVHPLGFEDCDLAGDEDCNDLADAADPACSEDTGTPDSGLADTSAPPDDAPVDTGEADDETGTSSESDSVDSGTGGDAPASSPEKDASGCGGCASGTGTLGMWLVPGLLAVLRRRQ